MSEITRVGVDLAKNVIQVHAVDAAGRRVYSRAVARKSFVHFCAQLPAGCVVAMEACTGAHHWARELTKLGMQVRLIAPHLVVPYRMQGKKAKNDANDAAAICEAASRPQMHFVPVKSLEQQGILSVHSTRQGWEKARTACINQIRAQLAEFGAVVAQGPSRLRSALPELIEDGELQMPAYARFMLVQLLQEWQGLDERIADCDRLIAQHARDNVRAKQAQALLGVGPLTASAVVATVADFSQFRSAAQFVAWLGLAPSQNSSGGKTRLGSITHQGNSYLRMLLVQGAKSAVNCSKPREQRIWQWSAQLRERAGWQKAAVALAAKNARILWAMFTRGSEFNPSHVSVKPGVATACVS